jgi:hypothetical protein
MAYDSKQPAGIQSCASMKFIEKEDGLMCMKLKFLKPNNTTNQCVFK